MSQHGRMQLVFLQDNFDLNRLPVRAFQAPCLPDSSDCIASMIALIGSRNAVSNSDVTMDGMSDMAISRRLPSL